jgi:hypothetical protein
VTCDFVCQQNPAHRSADDDRRGNFAKRRRERIGNGFEQRWIFEDAKLLHESVAVAPRA